VLGQEVTLLDKKVTHFSVQSGFRDVNVKVSKVNTYVMIKGSNLGRGEVGRFLGGRMYRKWSLVKCGFESKGSLSVSGLSYCVGSTYWEKNIEERERERGRIRGTRET
jgi:hypothetical protein